MIGAKKQEWLLRGLLIFMVLFILCAVAFNAYATWTPLVASTDFDGIRADVTVIAVGIVSVMLIVVGIGILIKVFK